MSKYWSDITKKIDPYIPGEQPKDKKYIKLNTNENPYPPSEQVIKAIQNAANENLKLYPDPTSERLRDTIADYYSLKKEQVFIGNGSDEILAFSFIGFFNPNEPILIPDITYSFYKVYSNLFNIKYNLISLNNDLSLPIDKFFIPNGGIIFPNPNAPTGRYVPLEFIEEVLNKNKDKVVIVDEAYIDFGGESSVKLIDKYENLLVIQTLSKSRSLAGLRVGFALGQEHLITGLDRIKNSVNSYTTDTLALFGAIEAIKDEEYFQETRRKIIDTRNRVSEELKSIGFNVIDSKTNFVFISHPYIKAEDIFNRLKEKNVLVRYFNQPRIDNFLRVSIGNDEEMNYFIKVIEDIVK
ncbi:histidinol-phosphate aminotransferase HisC [Gottschalkia purinilytica]|uniref:Histidinol-phosphate aminotransferase n=1 Tax=Gottschalkia purinilytica TaxID=1503 RepID=A0A0L0W8D4_GOTPU|nr:histidinol-phosphate transaminase [Gottschalkia purinilytica]KNF07711.1 histidinol-phosphate aminotransferase HisC [Gottschalkia purinilytica]